MAHVSESDGTLPVAGLMNSANIFVSYCGDISGANCKERQNKTL